METMEILISMIKEILCGYPQTPPALIMLDMKMGVLIVWNGSETYNVYTVCKRDGMHECDVFTSMERSTKEEAKKLILEHFLCDRMSVYKELDYIPSIEEIKENGWELSEPMLIIEIKIVDGGRNEY